MYAVHPSKMTGNNVCVKEIVHGYEISIAFDDSCGALKDCQRGEIRVFDNITRKDITAEIFDGEVIVATIDNLTFVKKYLLELQGLIG